VTRESSNTSVERMAAGGHFSQYRTRRAAAIAHFSRSASGVRLLDFGPDLDIILSI
jgi:hypothetical protein